MVNENFKKKVQNNACIAVHVIAELNVFYYYKFTTLTHFATIKEVGAKRLKCPLVCPLVYLLGKN